MFGKRAILLFLASAGMCFGQWVQVDSGLPANTSVRSFAVSGINIFAGSDNGVFLSTNNGTSWTAVDSGLSDTSVWSLTVSGSNIFAGTGSGVFLSTNNGTSWTAVNNGLTNMSVGPLAVSGSNILAGAGGDVFLSPNNGTSWTAAVDSGLHVTDKAGNIYENRSVNSLAVSGSNIFAAYNTFCYFCASDPPRGCMPTFTACGYVLLSTNNGRSWTEVFNIQDMANSGGVTSLAVSGNNIFAGTWPCGVFHSPNNGTDWTAVDSGLSFGYTSTWSLLVSGSNIFVGTQGGVFLSTNNGTCWTSVNSGITYNYSAYSLAVSGNYVFAGTNGGGIWRRPLSEMVGVINPNPQHGKLKPYASGFKINIRKNGIAMLLPETLNNGAITVGLFTIAGKRIYSATHQTYNGALNIPILGLSTGTYLMSIKGNNTTLSSPFVVTR